MLGLSDVVAVASGVVSTERRTVCCQREAPAMKVETM
jgi:hypothetical protein